MHSYYILKRARELEGTVLILVVMEDALVLSGALFSCPKLKVLILVVMEDALVPKRHLLHARGF